MKKLAVLFSLIILCMASNAYAKETAVIPSFDVHFNGNKVESEYREYPLLVYKDITYFPMTYFDSRHLGIETQWDVETNTLTISRTNINSILSAYKIESKNPAKNEVTVCDFNIIVNSKEIDNKNEEYPLLTFRDVTYFPLTWRFAVDMFHWEYSFSSENGLVINSANHKVKMLDLSFFEMNALYDGFTCDGEYYYHHNSASGNIYRTPVDDLDNQEIICNIGSGIPAGLGFSDGKVFLNYHSGGATMGTTYQYYINKDKTLTEANPPRSTMVGAVSYYRAYGDGVTAELSFFTGTWEFCYYIGENKTEVKIPGIFFGTPGRHSSDEVIPPQIVGDNIYLIGYKGEEETKILYSINVKNGEISEIASNVDNFVAYDTFVSRKNGSRIKIIYSAEGKLYQYLTETKELFVIDNDSKPLVMMVPMVRKDISTTVSNPYTGMYVVTGDEEGYSVFMFDDARGIDPPSRQGALIMEFSPKTSFSYQNGYLIARDKSENPKARLVVFDPWNGFYVMSPFKSADDATAITIFGNTLIYKNIETGEFCAVELKI